ncbi:MAG TPA: nucleotidyltransferase family protein [Thermoplasmata archaeon]|jgi:molybdenum cofactor cytidylyltransferase|nr:nucleotidyltransferase family protein [Thermoplasmata archaeon]
MATAALLLSGGESNRFGGTPKALMPVGGRPAVRRLAEICLDRGLDPVVVVVGPHRGPIAHELRETGVTLVDSELWYEGRTASIHSGLEAIPTDRDVLFWPVDHPFVLESTIDALLAAPSTDALAVWFIPTHEGHGGHPVYWRSSVRGDILDLRSDAPLRSLLPEFGVQVRRIAVNDPGVVTNVDTPEEYRTALEEWASRSQVL